MGNIFLQLAMQHSCIASWKALLHNYYHQPHCKLKRFIENSGCQGCIIITCVIIIRVTTLFNVQCNKYAALKMCCLYYCTLPLMYAVWQLHFTWAPHAYNYSEALIDYSIENNRDVPDPDTGTILLSGSTVSGIR